MQALILGLGSVLRMAVFEVAAESARDELSFAAGTDNSGWARPAGDPIHLALKPSKPDDLPAGLTPIDWHIAPSIEFALKPVDVARPRISSWKNR